MHQRYGGGPWSLVRRKRRRRGRAAARGAARGRRLELRGGAGLYTVVLWDHDQRARRAAGTRTRHGRDAGVGRGPAARRGVPARARTPAAQEHRRADRRGLAGVLVPDAVVLRHTSWPGVFSGCRRRPDRRLAEAVDVLRSKRQSDGTWLLENTHPGRVHFALEDGDGRPSRWNTLRALRVLKWHEQAGAGQ